MLILKRRYPFCLAFFFCLFFYVLLGFVSGQELSPRFKDWLELVKPIITVAEKEVFTRLRTDEERDKFIAFFWKQRDPQPDTQENEFFQEYMRRVSQADSLFKSSLGKRGSQTERGYYYLLLGPPLERHLFTTYSELWPVELWFCRGDERYNLPPYFYLIFYQPRGEGDYRLYYPGVEGPEKLVVPSLYGRTANQEVAYNLIRKISPELASASLSLIPGEKAPTATSLSSQTVLASIRSLPEKKFNDAYARNYLNYQARVEVDYADCYVESYFRSRVFRRQGQAFLHWVCEPKQMSFAPEEGGMARAIYELSLRIETDSEQAISEITQEIPLRLRREEYESQAGRIFSFQDFFPVIPGKFRLHFLLKNKTIKEFTSSTADFVVPFPSNEVSLGKPLIYYQRERASLQKEAGIQAFTFGGWHYLTNARPEIPRGIAAGFLTQVFLPEGKKLPGNGWLRLVLHSASTEEVVQTEEWPLAASLVSEEILDSGLVSLNNLTPGYYYGEIFLLDEKKQTLARNREEFVLLNQYYPPIPRILARVHPGFPDVESLKILSSQYFLAGRYLETLEVARRIVELNDDLETKVLMAKSLFGLGRYQESLTLIFPLYESHPSAEMAKVIALNFVNLGKWAEALPFLEKLLQAATELSVLNLTAECYLRLDLAAKALPLIQKSLELDPNQPQVKKMQEIARKKTGR